MAMWTTSVQKVAIDDVEADWFPGICLGLWSCGSFWLDALQFFWNTNW